MSLILYLLFFFSKLYIIDVWSINHIACNFLTRPPCQQLPAAEMSENDDGVRKFSADLGNVEKSDSLLQSGLIVNSQKDNDVRSSVQVQPSGSSGCVDEYWADAVDVDCAHSEHGVNISLKQSFDVLQSSVSGRTDSKKALLKFDNKNDAVSKVDVAVAMIGKVEESIQGKLTCDIEPNEYPKMESNSCSNHASEKQQSENISAQVTTGSSFLTFDEE